MTREDVKQQLPVIQAFAEGKAIQYYDVEEQKWKDPKKPAYSSLCQWRIKPDSQYHGFYSIAQCENEMLKHEPFGFIKDVHNGSIHSILSVEFGDFLTATITTCGKPKEIELCNMADQYIFMDGTPFGIAIEEDPSYYPCCES